MFYSEKMNGQSKGLNMELDLQSLVGLHVHSCTVLMAETPQLPPPSVSGLIQYTRALLVSQDRRHLFVTPWGKEWGTKHVPLSLCTEFKVRARGME
jgi:hypothetical protein